MVTTVMKNRNAYQKNLSSDTKLKSYFRNVPKCWRRSWDLPVVVQPVTWCSGVSAVVWSTLNKISFAQVGKETQTCSDLG